MNLEWCKILWYVFCENVRGMGIRWWIHTKGVKRDEQLVDLQSIKTVWNCVCVVLDSGRHIFNVFLQIVNYFLNTKSRSTLLPIRQMVLVWIGNNYPHKQLLTSEVQTEQTDLLFNQRNSTASNMQRMLASTTSSLLDVADVYHHNDLACRQIITIIRMLWMFLIY